MLKLQYMLPQVIHLECLYNLQSLLRGSLNNLEKKENVVIST